MKKTHLLLLALGIVTLAGVAYLLLFDEPDQQNSKSGSVDLSSNVDFGDLGYVYSKKTVKELNSDKVYPQSARESSEYYVKYPDKNIERKLFSDDTFQSPYSKSFSTAKLLGGVLEVTISEWGELNPETSTIMVTMDGDEVTGTQYLAWAKKNEVEGNIVSPNQEFATRTNITPSTRTDMPEPSIFESLDIININDEVLYSYKPEAFSNLGGIYPVAFSPDSKKILIKAQYVQPQELFSPQIYFLQTLGGEKVMIADYNTDGYPQESDYTLQEVSFINFLDSNTLFGTQMVDNYVDNTFDVNTRKQSFITFNIETGTLHETDVFYRDIVGIDEEKYVAYYLDAQGYYYSYNFLSGENTKLSHDFLIPEYTFYTSSPDFNFLVYTKKYEQEAEERSVLPVNGPYNRENVTEFWVYDAKTHATEKIITDIHHKGGDALGDEFYHFVGFTS